MPTQAAARIPPHQPALMQQPARQIRALPLQRVRATLAQEVPERELTVLQPILEPIAMAQAQLILEPAVPEQAQPILEPTAQELVQIQQIPEQAVLEQEVAVQMVLLISF
ncbi:hypothetical protein B1207_15135 [Legionella quinlivanii]|uniref:Uncharacterized protein n=1 Tax=Legionella quinlivanii TaxID=45073 RepID=A0A364LFS3_9GAMM|nr:hypothetical protein B1207_15135 [Legionella quinlivanii]